MAATNFKTENNTFRKLIGNGLTYRIPRFQRDYSWTPEEWEDLWADILAMLQDGGEPAHYMGYLVLQSADDKRFDVIDGQQRLTTLSILVLAILKNLQRLVSKNESEAEANQRRLEQIQQTYVGYLDPVTLVSRPKLELNRNNNHYYQNHLVPLGHLPQRGLRASEHTLRKAFEWFDREVGKYISSGSGEEGRRLAQLMEDVSDRLFFTVITVTDELNAYKVFETLNARGVRLSATDLLKNYLFSVLDRERSDHEIKSLEDRWEAIVGRLQTENFPDFLRVHWNSRNSFSRQAELFKKIRLHVQKKADVFKLLREMEEDLDTYLALSSPEISGWPREDQRMVGILRTFRVRQPFSLLLAAKRTLDPSEFSGLLRSTMVISLRYNVIGALSTGEQDRVYTSVAQRVARKDLTKLNGILQALKPIYVEDGKFRADFSEKSIRTTDSRNNRVARFLLCALEQHLTGVAHEPSSEKFNVEHVLPQHAPDGWGGFNNEEADALIYRLGNMTLMDISGNRDAGNQEYIQKRPLYESSSFELTKRIASENKEWTAERIGVRQAWMADQATAIWRIAQLS